MSVKVNVDRAGNVEDAELDSRGPSKYFARAALQAAQDWKFRPAMVDGRGVLSTWILRFEFTRGGTTCCSARKKCRSRSSGAGFSLWVWRLIRTKSPQAEAYATWNA